MRKILIFILTICVALLAINGVIFYKKCSQDMEQKFFEESEEMVENPYQGTYVQITLGDPKEIDEKRDFYPNHDMVLLALDLRECIYDNKKINDRLDDLEYALNVLREKKISVIFRAAYDFEGEYEEPELKLMLSHIAKIGDVLNDYKDCLAGVQAGMIGPYGEWHSSDYMKNQEDYTLIVDTWLNVLDEEIPLALRRPEFIRQAEKTNLNVKRIGIYNDGLFASFDDLGTYQEENYDRNAELVWSETNIEVPFNGGEMPKISEYTEIGNVVKEAKQLKLSYLNRYYDKEVWEFWSKQTYEDMSGDEYLKKYLGVRPWIKSVSYNKNFPRCKRISVDIDLRNSGFSVFGTNTKAYIFLKWQGEEEILVRDEAVISMHTNENGTIEATIENPCWLRKSQSAKIGIMFTRGEDSEKEYQYRLANKDIVFEDGIHWIVEYENEEE